MAGVCDPEPSRESLDRRVAALAARQYGVFSFEQIAALGATEDRVKVRLRAGRWERQTRGVYRLNGGPPHPRAALMAACLAWGRGVAVSHQSAAADRGLPGFVLEPVHLTVPPNRRRQGPWIVHRNALKAVDVVVVGGLPVTTVARTLIDVAALVDEQTLEIALDDALRRGLVSLRRLQWRLEQLASKGRPGVKALRELLGAPDRAVSRTVFETRLRRLMRRGGLPDPVGQYRIDLADGRYVVADFAFPEAKLIVEADGYAWHSGRDRWERDLDRRNELTLLGWRMIHVTWHAMDGSPAATVEKIGRALGAARPGLLPSGARDYHRR